MYVLYFTPFVTHKVVKDVHVLVRTNEAGWHWLLSIALIQSTCSAPIRMLLFVQRSCDDIVMILSTEVVDALSIVMYLHSLLWCTCTLYCDVLALSIVMYLHSLLWCTCTLYCDVLALSIVMYLHSRLWCTIVMYLHSLLWCTYTLYCDVLTLSMVVHLCVTVHMHLWHALRLWHIPQMCFEIQWANTNANR